MGLAAIFKTIYLQHERGAAAQPKRVQ